MSADPPAAEDPGAETQEPGDSGSEISMVIRALRAADLRLQELTAGEVDSVSDREGDRKSVV